MPLTPAIELPTRINGHLWDYSSVKFRINGVRIFEVTDLNYKHGLKPGVMRGTGAKKRGRTRGTYDADGGFTITKASYQLLLQVLGGGGAVPYMEVPFDIQVSYGENAGPTVTDVLEACRITEDEDSPSEGEAPATVKVTLDINEVIRNGIRAVKGDDLTP
jgi:hypothetical protein